LWFRRAWGSAAPPASIQNVARHRHVASTYRGGSGVSICNIVIHALVMTAVVRVARTVGAKKMAHPAILLICVMVATVSVLMAAHMLEVLVWALAYAIVDAAPAGADLVYFAWVNYTTLGYGDVIPMARWRLLGPMTAMNGVLLFGW